MDDCPTCGFPMTWTETYERVWCSVYGDHWDHRHGRNVIRRRRSDVIDLDDERERRAG